MRYENYGEPEIEVNVGDSWMEFSTTEYSLEAQDNFIEMIDDNYEDQLYNVLDF